MNCLLKVEKSKLRIGRKKSKRQNKKMNQSKRTNNLN